MLNKTEIITNDILRGLFKIKKLRNYSKLKKDQLIIEYNKYLASIVIQRCFRKYFYKDATDPITLEKVEYPCFIYRLSKTTFFYNYDSIIKYIMKSGNVTDPCTRAIYSDEDLLRLDNEAKRYFPDKKYKSTLKIKNSENYSKRIRNRENEILSFQMRLSEIKNIFINVIHDGILSWNIGPIRIHDVDYQSIDRYTSMLLYEFKIIFLNLKSYSPFEANCFKTELLSELSNLEECTLTQNLKNI